MRIFVRPCTGVQFKKANVWRVTLETPDGVLSQKHVFGFIAAASAASSFKSQYPEAEVRLPKSVPVQVVG